MKRFIVAIPLFAAIWLAAPVNALAQDPAPDDVLVLKAPRTALPRPVERPVRAAEPRVIEADPPSTPPEADDQRRGQGRGGRDTGRNPGRNSGDSGRVAGRDNNRGGSPRVAIARPPNVPVYGSSYRRQQYYPPAYYDRWARRTYRWSPLAYAPWALIYGSVGFSNYGYSSYGPYGNYGPYGYSPYGYGGYGYGGRSTTFDTGSVRLRIRPRDAQVFVDGYFAGYVDDFDGNFQSLRLELGGHKIEVRMPGFETLELDVHVQPNRTITLREDLIPQP